MDTPAARWAGSPRVNGDHVPIDTGGSPSGVALMPMFTHVVYARRFMPIYTRTSTEFGQISEFREPAVFGGLDHKVRAHGRQS